MTRPAGGFSILLLFLVCLSIAPALALPSESECVAEVSVDLASQEERDGMTLLRFAVELHAAPECSTLSYDLLIEEMLPNKQTKIIRMPRQVELEDGSRSETVEHSMTTDLKMLGYEASLVACHCPHEQPEDEDPGAPPRRGGTR